MAQPASNAAAVKNAAQRVKDLSGGPEKNRGVFITGHFAPQAWAMSRTIAKLKTVRDALYLFWRFSALGEISPVETIENWSLKICHLSSIAWWMNATNFAASWEGPSRPPKPAEDRGQATSGTCVFT
jgi:hypothetical protein